MGEFISKIQVEKLDEVFYKIHCDESVAAELHDYFAFKPPGYQFTPSYKNKIWDGYIRLFNRRTSCLYSGLIPRLESFFEDMEYPYFITDDEITDKPFARHETELIQWLEEKSIRSNGELIYPRDYQEQGFVDAMMKRKQLFLSPTASGKSLIIYLMCLYMKQTWDRRTLIIVPTTNLVLQMKSDFEDYGSDKKDWGNIDTDIHPIYSGKDKVSEATVDISTWQSLYKMDEEFFNRYDMVIVDEAHLAQANSIRSIMEKCTDVSYRFGLTATLSSTESKCHRLMLEGLFGEVTDLISTKELMNRGQVANIKIDTIFRTCQDREVCKQVQNMKYQQEIDHIVKDDDRNQFIVDLAANLQGNTLILVNFVDKHGKVLYNKAYEQLGEVMPVHQVFGSTTNAETREAIRKAIEDYDHSITIASYGVFSTGINIKRIHNIIFASPSKSAIRVLQSIGRGLRLADGKAHVKLFDIIDNYRAEFYKKNNYALKHGLIRCTLYDKQMFDYRVINLNTSVKEH